MTQQMRVNTALAEDQSSIPSYPTLGESQAPVTPESVPLASKSTSTRVHRCTCRPTHVQNQ